LLKISLFLRRCALIPLGSIAWGGVKPQFCVGNFSDARNIEIVMDAVFVPSPNAARLIVSAAATSQRG